MDPQTRAIFEIVLRILTSVALAMPRVTGVEIHRLIQQAYDELNNTRWRDEDG